MLDERSHAFSVFYNLVFVLYSKVYFNVAQYGVDKPELLEKALFRAVLAIFLKTVNRQLKTGQGVAFF